MMEPATRETVYRPYLAGYLFAAAAFFLAGAVFGGLAYLFFARPGANAPVPIRVTFAIFALAPIALAATWVVSFFRENQRPCLVPAVDVPPDLPREPVHRNLMASRRNLIHQWIQTSGGGVLGIDPVAGRRSRLRHFLLMASVAAAALISIWTVVPPFAEVKSPVVQLVMVISKIALTVIVPIATFAVFIAVSDDDLSCERELAFDGASAECTLGMDGRMTKIPLADIVGIQLCLFKRNLAGYRHWALEVNLVWRASQHGVNNLSRETLLLASADFGRFIALAQTMADTLDVPVFNHATPDDWRREKQLPPRPPVHGSMR